MLSGKYIYPPRGDSDKIENIMTMTQKVGG